MKKKAASFDDALALLTSGTSPSTRVLRGLNTLDGDQLTQLQAVWPALSDDRRASLVEHLRQMAEDDIELDFTAIFQFTLSDIDERVRLASVDGLWEDESLAIIDPLVMLMRSDPSVRVRAASAISLGRFMYLGEVESISRHRRDQVYSALMAALLTSPADSPVRRFALESVAWVSNEEVETHIREAYASGSLELRIGALVAMGRSCDPKYADIVRAELKSAIPAMRREAARACGEIEVDEAVPELGKLLNDPNPDVCLAAISALGELSGGEVRNLLERAILSDDEDVVEAAEDALAEHDLLNDNLQLPTEWIDEMVGKDKPGDPLAL